MLSMTLWDVLTIGAQAVVVILIIPECRHPLRYPTWSLAWGVMLCTQLMGFVLRLTMAFELPGRLLPDWMVDRGLLLGISLGLIYFLLTIRRMFPATMRPWSPTPNGPRQREAPP